jgi:hypothetical protein
MIASAPGGGVRRRPGIGHTFLLASLGRILLLAGERDDGLRCVQEGLRNTIDLRYPPGIAQASGIFAWQEVRDGQAQDAIARLEPILDARRAAGLPSYSAVYARAQLETGEEQRAAEILDGARQLAAASSQSVPPEVLLHSARLAARQGRWDDAAADLDGGLADTLGGGLHTSTRRCWRPTAAFTRTEQNPKTHHDDSARR